MSETVDQQAPLWRPFHDEPLFTPELLLGAERLDAGTRARIGCYLRAVTVARGGVLHVACAWNALHFGFDLSRGAYHSAVLDPEYFQMVSPSSRAWPAVAAGAFVRIERGERWVWAEAVGKFGACADCDDDGWIPAARSGDRATLPLGGGTWGRAETVVVDTAAFGSPTAVERKEVARLRRTGLLDARGHLTTTAVYREPYLADLDDTSYYQHHLLTTARPLLMAGPLTGLLDDPHDHELLSQALAASFTAVADILAHTDGLRVWGAYAAACPSAPLPQDLTDEIIHQVARAAPHGARYTAVWPLLRQAADSYDVTEHTTATAALATIVAVNLALADRATSPSTRTDLRIDDPWQQGGIWRAQSLPLPSYLADTDPLTPLGIGHREHTRTLPGPALETDSGTPHHQPGITAGQDYRTHTSAAHTQAELADRDTEPTTGKALCAAAEPTETPVEPHTIPEPAPVVEHLDDSLIVFTCALTQRHIDQGELPLPAAVREELVHAAVLLELHHELDLSEALRQELRRTEGKLTDATWPYSFYPGIKLTVSLPRAGRRLYATTTALDEPLYLDGHGPFAWDCDTGLLRRHLGLAGDEEQPTKTRRAPAPAVGYAPAVDGLRALITAGIRRHGTPGMLDERSIQGAQLSAALFGPDPVPPTLLWTVIHTCEDMAARGLLEREHVDGQPDMFTWWPSEHSATYRAGRHTPQSLVLRDHVKAHYVPPDRRKLPAGQHPSDHARSLYAQWRREMLGPEADTALPEGYTFVRGHRRGTTQPPAWHSDLT